MENASPQGVVALVIVAKSLCHRYGPSQNALQGLGFTIDDGLIIGLAGANGAGKSTLLCLLAGLYTPTSGSLSIDGHEAALQSMEVRKIATFVPQEADLSIIGSSIAEDLRLGLASHRINEALDLARRLGLPAPDTQVHKLSHGQKRKLCLAAALVRKPRLLLLDEPFAGLDYSGIREMRALLRDNQDLGLTQVVAVHDLEPLADLADLWLVLDHGQQAAFGPATEVFPVLLGLNVRPPCFWLAGLGVLPWDDSPGDPAS